MRPAAENLRSRSRVLLPLDPNEEAPPAPHVSLSRVYAARQRRTAAAAPPINLREENGDAIGRPVSLRVPARCRPSQARLMLHSHRPVGLCLGDWE